MEAPYDAEVQAIVSLEIDRKSAADYLVRTGRRLESVRLLGDRIALHCENVGVTPPRKA